MSKILRRPMFRGGGPVSSYGNGITAPLVSGYQMGGNVRGGIVDLPGGYNLTANERFLNSLKQDFGNVSVGTSGASTAGLPELTLGSQLMANNIPPSMRNKDYVPPGVIEKKQSATDLDYSEMSSDLEPPRVDYEKIPKYIEDPENPDGIKIPNPEYTENTTWYKEIFGGPYKKKNTQKVEEEIDTSGNDLPPSLRGIDSIPDLTKDKSVIDDTEEVEISAKDAIAENQELFKELLGSKKARGQDISDMLLRFSGSQGNTLGEKFQNYTRAESAAGPGRGEKINQTAAALAINDYVAGKRSKESLDTLLAKTDYDYKKKGDLTQINKDDSWRSALNKKAVMLKADTTTSGRVVAETIKDILDTREDPTPVTNVGKSYKDLDDINKKIDKLNVGINVIVLKNGTTIVVEKEFEDSKVVKETPFKV